MKNTTKLLNFNPDRKLLFNEYRRVDIPLRRDLIFDTDRELSFDSERDLPYGERGVTFRHFACGNCGQVVEGSAPKCPKCGAWFVSEETQVISDTKVKASLGATHSGMTEHFGAEYKMGLRSPPKQQPRYHCNSCGSDLRYIQSRRKWYCDRCKVYIGTSTRGPPKPRRVYQPRGGGAGGVKFSSSPGGRQRRPGEVVIVEDIDRKRRMRY
jgi:ribosomal protein L37AE/L43A